ncbi:sialin-like [Littorina saxatilis]|uniref:Major facilitator superfamily (MFS) profile domain-containing protein n=1 Tax=Littorina saxatilis TaxID=31220 RepID=A0AAN9BRW1_9CAEN
MTKEHKINRDEDEEEYIDPDEVPFWTSARLGLAVMGFFGFILVYSVRVNLSVAIVCMVNRTAIAAADDNNMMMTNSNFTNSSVTTQSPVSVDTECAAVVKAHSGNGTSGSSLDMQGTIVWDKKSQGAVLGAFFWGYLVSQIPSGLLAVRIGGKWCFGVAMLMAGVLTILTPVIAVHSFEGMMVVRILLGAVSGITFPAMHCLWGSWAPPLERTKLMAFTYAGAQVGNVITFPLAGFLCKYGFADGWPSIFYVLGVVCLVWAVLWLFFSSNSPAVHGRITELERRYILSSLKSVAQSDENKKNVPWKSIATSLPNYAIIVSNITSDWGAYTLLTNIPTYISEVLKFDIASNGLVSALPYIGMWATMNFSGWLSDLIRRKEWLGTGATRKVMDAFGKVVAGALLIALGYVDCTQPVAAIALLVMAVSIAGFQYSGFLVNHVDIAPQYAGILFGISNSIAAVTGFLSPFVVGVITEENQTRAEWQIVFYVAAAIYLFGAIFYVIFASGVLQPWAMKPGMEDTVDVQEPVLLSVTGKDKEDAEAGDRLMNDKA